MEYHRISFIHDDTEYSFIKAMNAGLTGYDLMKACRVEVTIYMKENNLKTRVRDKDCVKNRVKRAKIVRFTLC